MEDFSKSLLLRDYDAVFVFNRENGQYHTLVLSKKLFNVVPSEGTYEEGMEVLAKYVLPEEREFFRRHTERDRILKLVDSVEKAVVQYRIRRDDGICLCRNLKFLPGDEKHILAALRDETDEVMEQIRDANILALKNRCINFIVSNLCENFMTVDVRTGMSTTVIGAGNGEMLPQQTFKEQILWFAENVVVPEERENYIQYFALDNLVARIRENGGGTVSMFCNVIYEDGRHELLIRSTLVKDTLDLRGEYVLLFAQDMTSIRKIEEANQPPRQAYRVAQPGCGGKAYFRAFGLGGGFLQLLFSVARHRLFQERERSLRAPRGGLGPAIHGQFHAEILPVRRCALPLGWGRVCDFSSRRQITRNRA